VTTSLIEGYKIYYNGTLACSDTTLIIRSNPVSKRYLFIGVTPYEDGSIAYPDNGIRGFTGSLADILIYSVPLPIEAIK
jgi:hypothetical protein